MVEAPNCRHQFGKAGWLIGGLRAMVLSQMLLVPVDSEDIRRRDPQHLDVYHSCRVEHYPFVQVGAGELNNPPSARERAPGRLTPGPSAVSTDGPVVYNRHPIS